MSNYEALREKLNEILPDRLELKFGCFVRRFHNTQPDMLLKIAAGTSEHSVYLASGHDGMPLELHGLSTQDIEAFEILGQRITVADVLRALYITDPLGRWVLQHNGALARVGDVARENMIEWLQEIDRADVTWGAVLGRCEMLVRELVYDRVVRVAAEDNERCMDYVMERIGDGQGASSVIDRAEYFAKEYFDNF